MPARDELTPAAKEDVRGIWLYTAAQWGERQADQYIGRLEAGFRKIANRRAVSRTFSERYPQVRVTRCEHHYVFYLHPEPTLSRCSTSKNRLSSAECIPTSTGFRGGAQHGINRRRALGPLRRHCLCEQRLRAD